MSDQPNTREVLIGAGVLFAVIVVLVVLFVDTPSDADREASAAQPACSTFRSASADYADGLLTRSEMRSRLQDVNNRTYGAPAEIRQASRDMLAAFTQHDDVALADAVGRMDRACSTYR